MDAAERFRQNAHGCRQRTLQARTAVDKASWLQLAEEWEKLAEEVVANSLDGLKAKGWVEKSVIDAGETFRNTLAGEAALKAKIPTDDSER
jgi:hypothetical protein